MKWGDFNTVLLVSRTGSFQGAAKLMGVSHTTVSRRVRALEQGLKISLFVHKGNQCTPTGACREIINAAARMEQDVHSVDQALREVKGRPDGKIRITTTGWIINYLLVPAFPAFTTTYPSIRVFFVSDLFDQSAYAAGPGLSLRFDLQPGRGELSHAIGSVGYAVYGPAGMDDTPLPWLSFSGGSFTLPNASWPESQGVALHDIRLLANDGGTVYAAIRAGVGKGLIPECLGRSDPKLKRLSGPEPELVRNLSAIVLPDVMAMPLTKAVITWLRDVLAEQED